jgi:hypothetical protein
MTRYTGGCLCGALRFNGGQILTYRSKSARGGDATIAIFTRNRPAWAVIPPGLTIFEALPP